MLHRPATGDIVQATDINQYAQAWEGDPGGGEPLQIIEVNDATKYAVDIRNLDTSNGYLLRIRNAGNEDIFVVVQDGLVLSKDMSVAAGITIDGVDISEHTHTGAEGDAPVIEAQQIPAESVTPNEIANRTRRFLVPVNGGWEGVLLPGNFVPRSNPIGYAAMSGVDSTFAGDFRVPEDYVSSLTIVAVVEWGGSSQDVVVQNGAYHGAVGEQIEEYFDETPLQTLNEPATAQLAEVLSVTPTTPQVGDYFTCYFIREGTNASDTLSGNIYFKGWLVSYLADS